jgi:hypothetical protein
LSVPCFLSARPQKARRPVISNPLGPADGTSPTRGEKSRL